MDSLKALRNAIIDLKFLQDGDTILLPQRIHLRHHDGKQAATCGQLGAGILGNHHPGLNSEFFLFNCSSDVISLAAIYNLLTIDGRLNSTLTTHTFFSCTVVVQSSCH